jgi:hypothetical protein
VHLTVFQIKRVHTAIFAALLLDLALWLFILVGRESVTTPGNFARTHPPAFVFPDSHGLVASPAFP